MRLLTEIVQQLPPSAENGLTADGVSQSRQRFGANRLTPLPREPLWKKFLEKFDEPIIKILLAAALLSMFVELFSNNPVRSEEHTSELQSRQYLVCRLLLEKKISGRAMLSDLYAGERYPERMAE